MLKTYFLKFFQRMHTGSLTPILLSFLFLLFLGKLIVQQPIIHDFFSTYHEWVLAGLLGSLCGGYWLGLLKSSSFSNRSAHQSSGQTSNRDAKKGRWQTSSQPKNQTKEKLKVGSHKTSIFKSINDYFKNSNDHSIDSRQNEHSTDLKFQQTRENSKPHYSPEAILQQYYRGIIFNTSQKTVKTYLISRASDYDPSYLPDFQKRIKPHNNCDVDVRVINYAQPHRQHLKQPILQSNPLTSHQFSFLFSHHHLSLN